MYMYVYMHVYTVGLGEEACLAGQPKVVMFDNNSKANAIKTHTIHPQRRLKSMLKHLKPDLQRDTG